MRFEAKHSFFKKLVGRNFINVPFSLAQAHQHWMCSQLLGSTADPGNKKGFLYAPDDIGEGKANQLSKIFQVKCNFLKGKNYA